jgi:hypothetical protein
MRSGLWGRGLAAMNFLGHSLRSAFVLLLLAMVAPVMAVHAESAGRYEGVASCAGSTCHGRFEGDGAVVRQDEVAHWQDPASRTGVHSRTYAALASVRGQQIARTLGLGDAREAKDCLGCHATPPGPRGERFQINDGVGCEGCHGPASGWLASHAAVGTTHADNVKAGLKALENPRVRANVCLDCHFGSAKSGQFVTHRMMAAGHPRVNFELDLFSTLQQHWNEDEDYAKRKGRAETMRFWAVGQAEASKRMADLFAMPALASDGAFPQFYFFDCQSCHRRIYDKAERTLTFETNGARPIPFGMPPFNDENFIMLSSVAKLAAPAAGAKFDGDVRAFHAALGKDMKSAMAAARTLAGSAASLSDALAGKSYGATMNFDAVAAIAGDATLARLTDYEGSIQAVMAVDTLLNALVKQGQVTVGAAAGIRASLNRAYAAVQDANGYKPAEFRAALGKAVAAIGSLR